MKWLRDYLNHLNWIHHGIDCDDEDIHGDDNYTTTAMLKMWVHYHIVKITELRCRSSYGDR